MNSCQHGLVGFCPDCPPRGRDMCREGLVGAPAARVKGGRDGLLVVVERVKANGAFDWFTYHLTRRGAQRAAKRYMADGTVRGWKP